MCRHNFLISRVCGTEWRYLFTFLAEFGIDLSWTSNQHCSLNKMEARHLAKVCLLHIVLAVIGVAQGDYQRGST